MTNDMSERSYRVIEIIIDLAMARSMIIGLTVALKHRRLYLQPS
jgi:hypothetical protein